MNDWKSLIGNLNKEGTISDTDDSSNPNYRIFYESDVNTEGTDENQINTHADLNDEYYKSIQTELENQLESNNASLDDITNQDKLKAIWPTIIWNESMAQLIAEFWYYYKKSENDFIVEKEDSTIDDYFTKGIIAAAGANASFRKSDIRNADAGYFFGREKATYEECYYFGDRSGEDWILTLESSYKDDGNQEKTGTKTYTLTDVVFKASQTTFVEKLLNRDFSTAADWIDNLLYVKKEGEEEEKEDNKWYGVIVEGETNGDYNKNHISSFTLIRVKKAEAEGEENIIVKVVPEIVKVTLNPWVLPWYNFDADTYSKVRGDDKHYSVLANEDYLQKTREQEIKNDDGAIRKKGNRIVTIKNEKGEEVKDDNGDPIEIDTNKNVSDSSYEWLRLLMPEHKRRVEVEDLNRNFWVIGQTLAAISAYLFDDDSPISKLIQGILNEILQLWENVLLLWAAIGTQKVRNYDKTHCEVVYLTNNDFQPYLKYDGFENEDPYQTAFKTEITKRLRYLKYQYSDFNLIILPCIRINNYEHNYYSSLRIPWVWIYNRNNIESNEEGWKILSIPGNKDDNEGINIDLNNYTGELYGLHEEEEVYEYIFPLEREDIDIDDSTLFYGLVREEIQINGEIKNKEIQNINLSANFFDAVKEIILGQETSILLYSAEYNSKTKKIETIINETIINETSDIDKNIIQETTAINKGYYQGEMLSIGKEVVETPYNIHVATYDYKQNNPDFNMSKYDVVADSTTNYKNKYFNSDREELLTQLEEEWSNNSYGKKDILFIKGQREYAAGYHLPCGFAVRFYINGEKQEYAYPLVTDQLGFNGVYYLDTWDDSKPDPVGGFATNHSENEYIILRQKTDKKLTSNNWSIMFISCYGGTHTPVFNYANPIFEYNSERTDITYNSSFTGYLGTVRALDSIRTIPPNNRIWYGDNIGTNNWSNRFGNQPGQVQQEKLSDKDKQVFWKDIEDVYKLLNGTDPIKNDEGGYYVDGSIFMGQTILMFGPGENQWGSRVYTREETKNWKDKGLRWNISTTLNGTEKGFVDLRQNYLAFLRLNSSGRPYSEGQEKNYDKYKDNGRMKMQEGDNLTDADVYEWIEGV